jgi:hypothetical protein
MACSIPRQRQDTRADPWIQEVLHHFPRAFTTVNEHLLVVTMVFGLITIDKFWPYPQMTMKIG